MANFWDSLFGGSPPSSFTSQNASTTTQPPWLTAAMQQLIANSANTSSTPYKTYPGPQVAGFTPAQQQSFTDTASAANAYQPNYAAAGQAYSRATNPSLDPSVFSSYSNPYTSQVVNTIAQLGNQNLMENVLPGVNSTFTGAGQFGSSRNGQFEQQAIRNNQQAISNAQGAALSTGFNDQLAAYQNAQQRALQAGVAQQSLGTAQQSAGLTGAAAENAVGTQQQNLNQTNLNTAYQNFLQQQQYPYQQENFMKGIISGVNPGTTTTGSQTMPATNQPGIAQQLIGLGTGAVGLGNAFGLFGSGAGGIGTGIANATTTAANDVAGLTGIGNIFREGGPVRPPFSFKRQYLAWGGMPRKPRVMGAERLPRMKKPSFGGMIGKPSGGFGALPSSGNAVMPPHVPPAAALPGSVTGGAAAPRATSSLLRSIAGGSRPSMVP